MFRVDKAEDKDKQRDDNKRHPQYHFSEITALNTFLKKDTCRKQEMTVAKTVALEPAF